MKQQIISFAKSEGFDLVRFTTPELNSRYLKEYEKWLDNKYEAAMAYMRKKEARADIKRLLPKAQTVICLALNYYNEQEPLKKGNGRIARYAPGRDYHKILRKKLRAVENHIKSLLPAADTRSYVDTGPILERAYAEQSGLGFIGKNGCLISEEYGSWIFLCEIITTARLAPDSPKTAKEFAGCGACRKCIDACPTGAIIAPGIIDSSRCISYLTIENRDQIPPALAKLIRKAQLLYGCDICQEVCPHNKKLQKPSPHTELTTPKIAGDQLSLAKISRLSTQTQFIQTFAGSALTRAKLPGLKRNAETLTKHGKND